MAISAGRLQIAVPLLFEQIKLPKVRSTSLDDLFYPASFSLNLNKTGMASPGFPNIVAESGKFE